MNSIAQFKESLAQSMPPQDISAPLKSLWYDAKGNWRQAHAVVDQLPGPEAARVHAYLHRKEGDIWNADYWYNRAKQQRPDVSLDDEREELLLFFIKQAY
ncbi:MULTISPECIES: hypothetical protein [unclassified Mucilaginibacter]|uniref:hypothetical protein n=1 Tax=unclassified Mucilaginibacter TaxID=2617802 RepID=UPI00095C3D39|nr:MULTISPECIES: hypothetical protein [unclassified Mucilaginibacter]OJW17321.1 MAG: hypothetical protein BGO48_07130 [Mucilaginibacter sp. 44-25]PLW91616.1 MAG: hypothetical protein C0154_00275 [Mucilaginibacter sp.]HEK18867.1 hypothetical protein [Bacteroidota bacterium]